MSKKSSGMQKSCLISISCQTIFNSDIRYPVHYEILHRKFFLERFDQFLMQKKKFESQNFAIFDKVVHKFGKSDEVYVV